MKVNRINILINRHANKHRTYLYNEMWDLVKEQHANGTFGNDYIKINSLPETATKILNDLKIKFERLGK